MIDIPKADYSAIAPNYDAGRRMADELVGKWVGLIRDRGRLNPGDWGLDLGCGTGRFTIPSAETIGARMVGADLSAGMLSEAMSKPGADGVRWVRCHAEAPAFRSESFQCVFMSLLIHHVDDRDRVVGECRRILKPGGVFLMRTSGHDDMAGALVYRSFPRAWEIDRNRLPDISVIEESMRRSGLVRVRHEKVVQNRYSTVEEYLERNRRKGISALTLLTDEEFAHGLRAMEHYLRSMSEADALAELNAETLTLVIGEKTDQIR